MLAFLFPITLDGLILAGSLLILYFAVRGKRSGYGLFLTALGVIVSIAGNVVISPNDITYQILHATSPVVLFLALESLMILLRARSRNAQEAAEKEVSEQKLQHDGYFHHKAPVTASKAPESPTVVSVPQTTAKPQQVAPKSSQPAPVTATPKPVVKAVVESVSDPVIDAPEPSAPQTLGFGKHSSRPAVVDVPQEVKVVPEIETLPEPVESFVPVESFNEPAQDVSAEAQPPSKREIIRDLLLDDPEMDAGVIVNLVGGDKKYVQKLIRAERAKITG